MKIRFACSNSDCRAALEAVREEPADFAVRCRRCTTENPVRLASSMKGGLLARCPCCEGDELYIRKAFPQKVGLALVVVTGLTSCVLFAMGRLEWSLGVLAAMVLVDLALYLMVPLITVCYRCRAEFRECPINPAHQGFDLATAEKYRG